MDSGVWDRRYADSEFRWTVHPNRFLLEEAAGLPPGRALDLGCGEGRNAVWLAQRGWEVTGVDFSAVGIEKARMLATERGLYLQWIVADLLAYQPEQRAFDLVLVLYLQLPAEQRRQIVSRAADAVAPAGMLLIVAHDSENIEHGHGGPQDPAVSTRRRTSSPISIAAAFGSSAPTASGGPCRPRTGNGSRSTPSCAPPGRRAHDREATDGKSVPKPYNYLAVDLYHVAYDSLIGQDRRSAVKLVVAVSRVVVLGAGIAGHTAAAFARSWLGDGDSVTVISPRPDYNRVPSNIWVGVGLMKAAQVTFPLAPIYARAGIEFVQAGAREIHPEGNDTDSTPYVTAEFADGRTTEVRYDFLINATGPALRFDKTPGLGPDAGHSLSVCLPGHAAQAATRLDEEVERMRHGERRAFLVGVGHGTCTCEGAAFEYIVNLEFELRKRGVRDKAEIIWITNEYELGDFGMGGMHLKRAGYVTPSSIFNASLFAERGIDWITRAHVSKVEPDRVLYETLDGTEHEQAFDFAMLLPPFTRRGTGSIRPRWR